MHLVFVTSLVPDGAPTTGYEIANATILDALRRIGARVTVVGYAWPGKAPAEPGSTVVLGEIDVRTDTASGLKKLGWLASAIRKRQTFAAVKLTELPVSRVRAALDAIGPFDGYILNGVHMPAAFPALFDDKPFIHVAHNVEHRTARENALAAGDLVQRLLYTREAKLLEAIEKRLCRDARFVFTLSDEDRATLQLADDRSLALPLVTRDMPLPPLPSRTIAHDAGLLGTWTWQPNRIGLDWFLEKVVPLLPAGFRVAVAGRAPTDLAAMHPGVEFVGPVADATEFLRGCAVLPLISRAGTGVQLKSIEALELGLPIVATRRSLRGIGHMPENVRLADEPEAFAEALVGMARDARDVDGRAFYRAQRRLLDERLKRGLLSLGVAPVEAAA